jgi:fumarylacetoacetase
MPSISDNLNQLAASGRTTWRQLRSNLSQALSDTSRRSQVERFLTPLDQVELGLPVLSRDFTDFFTSYFHAYNAGKLFRPDDPLTPNFKWMPIAYHGRASSIVLSGTSVCRPWGQIMAPDSSQPTFAPSRFVDFETELGFVVGPGTGFGEMVTIDQAEDHSVRRGLTERLVRAGHSGLGVSTTGPLPREKLCNNDLAVDRDYGGTGAVPSARV